MAVDDDKTREGRGALESDGYEIDLDESAEDLDAALAQAVAAVEQVERQERSSEQEIERLERELAELRDRSTRTLADFDNFRKRAERERLELRKYALSEPFRDLLEVLDNLDRAVAAGGSAEDLRQGVSMIARQFLEVLKRHGVAPINSLGERFDPLVHEAVSRHDRADVSEPTVSGELARGYYLHERLLRPALVTVAVPAPKRTEPAEG
jgi:molecular chaperone GrpE